MADKLVKCEAAWEKFFEKADVNSDGSVSIECLTSDLHGTSLWGCMI